MSRPSSPTVPVLIGIAVAAVLLLLLVAGLGGVGVRTTGSGTAPEVTGGFPEPVADGSYGVVFDTQATESPWNFFGLKIGSPKFYAFIGLVPPAGCLPQGDKLEARGACEGIVATGTISGGGTTSGGIEFLIVQTRVSEACHATLQPGDRWPSSAPACRK